MYLFPLCWKSLFDAGVQHTTLGLFRYAGTVDVKGTNQHIATPQIHMRSHCSGVANEPLIPQNIYQTTLPGTSLRGSMTLQKVVAHLMSLSFPNSFSVCNDLGH